FSCGPVPAGPDRPGNLPISALQRPNLLRFVCSSPHLVGSRFVMSRLAGHHVRLGCPFTEGLSRICPVSMKTRIGEALQKMKMKSDHFLTRGMPFILAYNEL